MAETVNAREEILMRVRGALAGSAEPEPVARTYRRDVASGTAIVDLLRERLVDYKAHVRLVREDELRPAVEEICAEHRVTRLGVPRGLPHPWRPAGVEIVEDNGLEPRELDRLDGVLTACTVAIAETGTLALSAGGEEGRRALSLVPDLHVCVVWESQIVATVPAGVARLAGLERRPLTLISGPSATSDIELSRVEGVHGPRRLVVLIVAE
jgi:L-lactate dehydrogenase complex protein LldG